jgi:trans-aconitate methyltransferase
MIHRDKAPRETSWFQEVPEPSLRLIAATGLAPESPAIDVGGGASTLVDHLLDAGWTRLTVLDLAAQGLQRAQTRLGDRAQAVRWLVADVTEWRPDAEFALWHDRAVFHFLTEPAQRDGYRRALRQAVPPGGHVIIATFAADGPERCSNLPVARYDAAELAAEFQDCLKLIETLRHEHTTPAGKVQAFTFCRFVRV